MLILMWILDSEEYFIISELNNENCILLFLLLLLKIIVIYAIKIVLVIISPKEIELRYPFSPSLSFETLRE